MQLTTYLIETEWCICLSNLTIIGSDNSLLHGRCQVIIWTNAGILLFGPLGRNFDEMFIKFHTFPYKKIHLKRLSTKWWPFCLGLSVLKHNPYIMWMILFCCHCSYVVNFFWFHMIYSSSLHYNDIIMSAMVSGITSLMIVYSTVCSSSDQRKHQSSTTLAYVRGIHQWLVNSPHKGSVTRKMFPFDDLIMIQAYFTLKVDFYFLNLLSWNCMFHIISCLLFLLISCAFNFGTKIHWVLF